MDATEANEARPKCPICRNHAKVHRESARVNGLGTRHWSWLCYACNTVFKGSPSEAAEFTDMRNTYNAQQGRQPRRRRETPI